MDERSLGLQQIVELNEPELSYEFNMIRVWRNIHTHKLYWAHSSGCSCPSPFEDYSTLEDLNNIHAGSWNDFVAAIDNFPCSLNERSDTIKRVRQLLEDDFTEWVKFQRQERGVENV